MRRRSQVVKAEDAEKKAPVLYTQVTMRNNVRADTYLPIAAVLELMSHTTLIFDEGDGRTRKAISFENTYGHREVLFIDLILGVEEREQTSYGWML